MIRMPQVDISQVVNRDTQGAQARGEGQQAPSGDFMAMVQQHIRAGDRDPVRDHEAQAARGPENREPEFSKPDAPLSNAAKTSAGDSDAPAVKKPHDEQREADAAAARTGEPAAVRTEKVKSRNEKKTAVAGDGAETAKPHQDGLRAASQAALQSLQGLNAAMPETRSLEKTLQAFQEMMVSGDGRAKRPELLADLRMRMKDALQQLEQRQESARGELREKIADAKGRIRTLEAMVEGQLRGGRRNAQQAQSAPAQVDVRAQADAHPVFHRDMRQSVERASDGENRDAAAGIGAMKNVQAQARMAAQATAPRMQLAAEQFEQIMNSARVVVRDGKNGSFIMNLYPETLGRVNINLGLEDGIIQGRFLVDSPEARDLMMENIDQLRARMEEAGLQVGSFQVNVRGERERLVRDLQESLAGAGRRAPVEAQRDYEVQSYRAHDGALDVIA